MTHLEPYNPNQNTLPNISTFGPNLTALLHLQNRTAPKISLNLHIYTRITLLPSSEPAAHLSSPLSSRVTWASPLDVEFLLHARAFASRALYTLRAQRRFMTRVRRAAVHVYIHIAAAAEARLSRIKGEPRLKKNTWIPHRSVLCCTLFPRPLAAAAAAGQTERDKDRERVLSSLSPRPLRRARALILAAVKERCRARNPPLQPLFCLLAHSSSLSCAPALWCWECKSCAACW